MMRNVSRMPESSAAPDGPIDRAKIDRFVKAAAATFGK
jgi:hypothetical protein